jgi:hypothetical protein
MMMRGDEDSVNVIALQQANDSSRAIKGMGQEKKPGSEEPGLRYWPREADTITFQEGLLNTRAAGGGGQMRNPNVQRVAIMIRVRAMQQPFTPHVRHAGSAGLSSDN